MKWLRWPVSVAVMTSIGRYVPYGVAVLARTGGRYDPYWPLCAVWRGCSGLYRWPLCAVLAVTCCVAWLFWPVSLAGMSRIGRYLPYEVAVLARVGGRYDPCWALFAVWRGCFGPYRWPFMSRARRYLLYEVAVLARIAGRYEPYRPLFAV